MKFASIAILALLSVSSAIKIEELSSVDVQTEITTEVDSEAGKGCCCNNKVKEAEKEEHKAKHHMKKAKEE